MVNRSTVGVLREIIKLDKPVTCWLFCFNFHMICRVVTARQYQTGMPRQCTRSELPNPSANTPARLPCGTSLYVHPKRGGRSSSRL